MIRDDRHLGQLSPAVTAATSPEPASPGLTGKSYFMFAVAAGVTVWLLTRLLDHAWPSDPKPRRLGRLVSHPSDHPEGE